MWVDIDRINGPEYLMCIGWPLCRAVMEPCMCLSGEKHLELRAALGRGFADWYLNRMPKCMSRASASQRFWSGDGESIA
jgi:hypothetical protein